jgi:hypothetical protein
MSINKLALVRYKTIDNCLRNRFRKWTLEDLVEACSDALYEYEGITKGVSKRTVQLDLQNMRSEKLGYNAPIIVIDKKYYSYEDKNYSITNIPLTVQDLGTLSEVVGVLKQFKGFSYFEELNGMVSKLEDKIHTQKNKSRSYISFEKNDQLKGLEFIESLHKAIITRSTLMIGYKSFKALEINNITFFPYLLKEYRNRWFVIGMKITKQKNKSPQNLLTLALDRVISVTPLSHIPYVECEYDMQNYFDDVIGVSKMPNQRAQQIILKVDKQNAPYLITKPLHPTQKILKDDADGMTLSIQVVWNFELEREILGFGESLHVLSPKRLREKISSRVNEMSRRYDLELLHESGVTRSQD